MDDLTIFDSIPKRFRLSGACAEASVFFKLDCDSKVTAVFICGIFHFNGIFDALLALSDSVLSWSDLPSFATNFLALSSKTYVPNTHCLNGIKEWFSTNMLAMCRKSP